MQTFHLLHPSDANAAVAAAASHGGKYIAGGTDLMQLMKDNVETPERLVDLEPQPLTRIVARKPGDTPDIETVLAPGEMIEAIVVPETPAAQRSHYLKVRDRTSFEFGLVSAAVALHASNGTIQDVRVADGGVGTKPWHLPEVEAALRGKPLNDRTLRDAAAQAGQGARPATQNAFKLTLLRRTVLRALQTVAA